MRISAKVDYACRALIELGLHWPNTTPIPIGTIAQRQKIPTKFLIHILINLKQLGFVESIRGKTGGYFLTVAPQKICLGEIVRHFQSDQKEKKRSKHVMEEIWGEVEESIDRVVTEINFEKICNRVRENEQTYMYNI